MAKIMKTKASDYNQTRVDLIQAMLTHVPFDGWTWEAMEQGAIDIGFENKKTPSSRMKIFKDLFKNGPIDFIDIFSEIIDEEVKRNYILIEHKPIRVPEKIKKIIMIRLKLCQKYKEVVRSSISLTAIPLNGRISLATVYTSTLLFWLNDNSNDNIETEFFLDRRLRDISKISSLKKPLSEMKKITNNFYGLKNTINIKSVFSFLKKINNIKNSSFS